MSKEIEAIDRAIASIDRLQASLLDVMEALDRPRTTPAIGQQVYYFGKPASDASQEQINAVIRSAMRLRNCQ